MNFNKSNLSIIFFAFAIVFLFYKLFPPQVYRQIKRQEVDLWKNKLVKAYFKGEVLSLDNPDNNDKNCKTITLAILDSGGIKIPDSCEYLKFRKNNLLLTALNINIGTGPDHKIEVGDILTKFPNTDSIIISTSYGCCKYYFPLFDGMGEKPVKMKITAKSMCQ